MEDELRIDPDTGWIDAGNGFTYVFFDNPVDHPAGIIERHNCPALESTSEMYGGSILFSTPYNRGHFPGLPLWTVEELSPLTLTQQFRCILCGYEGILRRGNWYPTNEGPQ